MSDDIIVQLTDVAPIQVNLESTQDDITINLSNPVTNITVAAEGYQGTAGSPGHGIVNIFIRSATAPASFSGGTYNYSTNSFSNLPIGWSLTIPSGTDQLYQAVGRITPLNSVVSNTITWTNALPFGAQGVQGPQGPTGATGATGTQGPQGIQGEQGIQGPVGLTGATGAQGLKGDKGDIGNTGPQGPAGANGTQGAQGADGDGTAYYGQIYTQTSQPVIIVSQNVFVDLNITGTFDTTNSYGTSISNVHSNYGIKNTSGSTQLFTIIATADIDSGNNKVIQFRLAKNGIGFPSTMCASSTASSTTFAKLFSQFMIVLENNDELTLQVANATNASDFTLLRSKIVAFTAGRQGEQGIQGIQGPQGIQGLTGAQGPRGDDGVQGTIGPTGSQGPIGDTGPQGIQGLTGPSGPQGIQGTVGPQGPVGATGLTGPQGPKGDKGDTGSFGGASFRYLFKDSIDATDPGVNYLKLNSSNPALATGLFIDDEAYVNSVTSTDIQEFLRTIDDSTSSIKGHFKISSITDSNIFAFYVINAMEERNGWFEVSCTYLNGNLTNNNFIFNEEINITFARTGDRGDTGSPGAPGPQGISYITLYRTSALTDTSVPTPTDVVWTYSTNSLSGTNSGGWSLSIPSNYNSSTHKIWLVTQTFNPATIISINTWGVPYTNRGLDSSNNLALTDVTLVEPNWRTVNKVKTGLLETLTVTDNTQPSNYVFAGSTGNSTYIPPFVLNASQDPYGDTGDSIQFNTYYTDPQSGVTFNGGFPGLAGYIDYYVQAPTNLSTLFAQEDFLNTLITDRTKWNIVLDTSNNQFVIRFVKIGNTVDTGVLITIDFVGNWQNFNNNETYYTQNVSLTAPSAPNFRTLRSTDIYPAIQGDKLNGRILGYNSTGDTLEWKVGGSYGLTSPTSTITVGGTDENKTVDINTIAEATRVQTRINTTLSGTLGSQPTEPIGNFTQLGTVVSTSNGFVDDTVTIENQNTQVSTALTNLGFIRGSLVGSLRYWTNNTQTFYISNQNAPSSSQYGSISEIIENESANTFAITVSNTVPYLDSLSGAISIFIKGQKFIFTPSVKYSIDDEITTKLLAGNNITLSKNESTKEVTINSTSISADTTKLPIDNIQWTYNNYSYTTNRNITPVTATITVEPLTQGTNWTIGDLSGFTTNTVVIGTDTNGRAISGLYRSAADLGTGAAQLQNVQYDRNSNFVLYDNYSMIWRSGTLATVDLSPLQNTLISYPSTGVSTFGTINAGSGLVSVSDDQTAILTAGSIIKFQNDPNTNVTYTINAPVNFSGGLTDFSITPSVTLEVPTNSLILKRTVSNFKDVTGSNLSVSNNTLNIQSVEAITSPNSTLTVGGTLTNPTIDISTTAEKTRIQSNPSFAPKFDIDYLCKDLNSNRFNGFINSNANKYKNATITLANSYNNDDEVTGVTINWEGGVAPTGIAVNDPILIFSRDGLFNITEATLDLNDTFDGAFNCVLGTSVPPGTYNVFVSGVINSIIPSTWLSGSGTPANNLGKVGDFYADTSQIVPGYKIFYKTGFEIWERNFGLESIFESYSVGTLVFGFARLVATTNINAAGVGIYIDGSTTIADDIVLLTAQTNSADNGLYRVRAGAVWLRVATPVIQQGLVVVISEGINGRGDSYIQTAPVFTVGTDPQVWDVFAQNGAYTLQAVTNVGNTTNRDLIIGGSLDMGTNNATFVRMSGNALKPQITAISNSTVNVPLNIFPQAAGALELGNLNRGQITIVQNPITGQGISKLLGNSSVSNTQLELSSSGTGSVRVGNTESYSGLEVVGGLTSTRLQAQSDNISIANQEMNIRGAGTGQLSLGNTTSNTGVIITPNLTTRSEIIAGGSGANIDLRLLGKGTGDVELGNITSNTGFSITPSLSGVAELKAEGVNTNTDLVLKPKGNGSLYPVGITLTSTLADQPHVALASQRNSTTLGFGTIGQVMTSNGTSGSPYWSNPSAATSFTFEKTNNQSLPLTSTTQVTFDSGTCGFGTMASSGTFTFSQTGAYLIIFHFNISRDCDGWMVFSENTSHRWCEHQGTQKGAISQLINVTAVNSTFYFVEYEGGTFFGQNASASSSVDIIRLG